MALIYRGAGLSSGSTQLDLVRALQRDLRALGYLRSGIDGAFGSGTQQAVRALSYDLLHNDGTGTDGPAPVAIRSYNQGRVAAVTGSVSPEVADCIESLLNDPDVPQLPSSADARAGNRRAVAAILASTNASAPPPFIVAMVGQESSGWHFRVPSGSDSDNFVVVGLDRNNGPDAITSRGYGIGQYTLFHHPPQPSEIRDFIVDPVRNVQAAFDELRSKFNNNVLGQDGADDRAREHPLLDLRLCKYAPSDRRYLRDCQACAAKARKVNITRGTPAYDGASFGYQPDQYYPSAEYRGVPDRADFPCDWPYAARRYNGSGNDSFHYQTRILLNLLAEPPVTWS